MSSEAFVQIQSVTKSFEGTPAVRSFDLDISTGEFVSLLGPSGCGKTTLLRMIGGFEFPDAGRILLDSRDVTDLPPHKRPVNMVFQRVTLFPHLNVFENVAFGLRLRRVAKVEMRKRVSDVLELVRLPGFEGREAHTLSGGQAQRVALARAIVNQPKVLLFDEPLSALDLQIRRKLQLELKDIHRELGSTFVYVTHDQEEAMSMSDRVVVMRGGEIVQAGMPVDLYRSPATLFVASFVGSPNVWRGRLVEMNGETATVAIGEDRFRAPLLEGATVGDDVALVLRSEVIDIAGHDAAPGASPSSIEGVVADVRFVGAVVSYRVDLGGRTVTVTRPSQHEVLAEGQRVLLTWRTQDALLLHNDINDQANSAQQGGSE
jgi:spermidine/putrescine transport system ATP-binding protein